MNYKASDKAPVIAKRRNYWAGYLFKYLRTAFLNTFKLDTRTTYQTSAEDALSKFYQSNDDLASLQATGRRALFGFLRTKPDLSLQEIDDLHAIADLVAELCYAQTTR